MPSSEPESPDREAPIPLTAIRTSSGRWIDLAHVLPSDIEIRDIAHALSRICRWSGHSAQHYSVAQHSMQVSVRCPKNLQLEGLLHDAAEAYIGDITRPMKVLLQQLAPGVLKTLETQIEQAIALAFGLVYPWPAAIKVIDDRVKELEETCFWPGSPDASGKLLMKSDLHPIDIVRPIIPDDAKAFFLARFFEIQKTRRQEEPAHA